MIKVIVQYNDHSVDIRFPCSETTLYSALTDGEQFYEVDDEETED